MCTRAIDLCNVCRRVDLVGPSGACLACRYEDESECAAECERCGEAIAAGEPVQSYGYADGSRIEVCDDCDTNHGATYARRHLSNEDGAEWTVRRLWTRTRVSRVPLPGVHVQACRHPDARGDARCSVNRPATIAAYRDVERALRDQAQAMRRLGIDHETVNAVLLAARRVGEAMEDYAIATRPAAPVRAAKTSTEKAERQPALTGVLAVAVNVAKARAVVRASVPCPRCIGGIDGYGEQCLECGASVEIDEAAADKCCSCDGCGLKLTVADRSGFGGYSRCETCRRKDAIRHNRENEKRLRLQYTAARAHLARLIAEEEAAGRKVAPAPPPAEGTTAIDLSERAVELLATLRGVTPDRINEQVDEDDEEYDAEVASDLADVTNALRNAYDDGHACGASSGRVAS